jgi:hypothetical protein
MEFTYTIFEEKTVDINFEDIYLMQHALFFDNLKDIDLDFLYNNFGDNLEYYLHKLGFIDFIEEENEYESDVICKEYGYWLDDNYNPSDFK